MDPTILEMLVNGSPMAAFAAYLLWANNRAEKKLDIMLQNFLDKLDALEDKHETRQEQTRERWMQVVAKLETEKTQLTGKLSEQHEKIIAILEVIKDK